VPKTIAMKEMGLVDVSIDEINSIKLAKKYSAFHNPQNKVKAICISGRHLFRESPTPAGGLAAPLHDLANEGKLEVLMPISSSSNPTVISRFATYSDVYKAECGFITVDDFVKEIDRGKKFLRVNHHNIIHEHDALCMWRAIIYDNHCIIQNYFPNSTGDHSYRAPTFVFAKKTSSDNQQLFTYYDTFCKMFDLLTLQA
jgi:hypothetical protein